MDWSQFNNSLQSLKALGGAKLGALAAVFVLVAGFIFSASYFATRSSYETLYVGLTQQDISRMGVVLSEAGIPFESSIDGTKLLVPLGQAAEARARLAEKGLPGSATAGYELFDKLGALGLTTFMQQVTKVRALEGELSRTIQNLRGIKAARVHIVLPETGTFRYTKQLPAASVVIKTEMQGDASSALAIRHLVASSIPEMLATQVSVISTDGTVLAAGSDGASELPSKSVELERTLARQTQDNIRRTLVPYLGLDNFEVSANVRVNVDKRQTSETNFDPDKRVERSVRVVKENQTAQEASNRTAVTTEQNVPREAGGTSDNDQNKRAQDRKEETTNYEVGTKSTSVTSEGYRIENLSIAVVVNKKKIAEALGKEPTEEELSKEIAELERLSRSAAGIDEQRGDKFTISAVNFTPASGLMEADAGASVASLAFGLAGTLVKSLTILGVCAMIIWAGFKPLTRALLTSPSASENVLALESTGGTAFKPTESLEMPEMSSAFSNSFDNPFGAAEIDNMGMEEGFRSRSLPDPKKRLEEIFLADEDRSTAVIRDWVRSST
ncbi:MAG: flagellar M-ring protein FliF [Hyphomicrobium sp.]|nr:flagellar M-ring protein FliF [Hyphomicrobium sp.]